MHLKSLFVSHPSTLNWPKQILSQIQSQEVMKCTHSATMRPRQVYNVEYPLWRETSGSIIQSTTSWTYESKKTVPFIYSFLTKYCASTSMNFSFIFKIMNITFNKSIYLLNNELGNTITYFFLKKERLVKRKDK